MVGLQDFTLSSARPLPVILIADISGSMAVDGKIDALNTAVAAMQEVFAEEDIGRAEIHLAVVTFGGTATMHVPLTPARDFRWRSMQARGQTPMGAALDIVTELLESREQIPSRAYRPTVVLVSDGIPTDSWRSPLQRLLNSQRAAKAQRLALGIGADANHDVLRDFLDDPEGRIFEAHEAREIRKFFQWLTMSVTERSHSTVPNEDINMNDFDNFDDF